MVRKRVQKSSERSPQPQESAIAPVGARSHSPSSHTQRDMESQEIQQHKHEATVLEIQAKYGTITPQGQERLTFLQAKMADYTQRKLDFGNRVYQQMFNSSGGDVSVTLPERKTAPPIQAKLTIGQPGDKYEQEADRVAAQVVNQIHAPTTQREALPDEQELQMKPAIGSIQRQTVPEDEVQMKSSGAGMTAPQDLETSIQQARGSGQSLADSIKQPMEQAFGADFSGVKIHTDAQSNQLNQSIQARAFTTGQDVFFRQGEYNPGSREGQELLAHELTHVVQQKGKRKEVQRKPVSGGLDNYTGPFRDANARGTFVTDKVTNADEVTALVSAIRRNIIDKGLQPSMVIILTGCHGDSAGNLYEEGGFYVEDKSGEAGGKARVLAKHIVRKKKTKIREDINNPNVIKILGWCYSAVSYKNWDNITADWNWL